MEGPESHIACFFFCVRKAPMAIGVFSKCKELKVMLDVLTLGLGVFFAVSCFFVCCFACHAAYFNYRV
jgi:hypothetical protein